MESTNHFDWVPFYRDFAEKLLGYKNRRKELCVLVHQIFEKSGVKEPRLEADGAEIKDIDPFSVYGLFNKNSMTKANRTEILNAIALLFNVSSAIPKSFDGVPLLNNKNATYYYYSNGNDEHEEIAILWGLFEAALAYEKKQTEDIKKAFFVCFDKAMGLKNIGNSKLTMPLYWIASDMYLSLDSVNLDYIFKSGKIPEKIVQELPPVKGKVKASQYLMIVDTLKQYLQSGASTLKDFKELSWEAWHDPQEIEVTQRPKYWLYAPGEGAKYWEEFYKAGIMGIGWASLDDLSKYETKDDLSVKMKEVYGPEKSHRNNLNTTWQFANNMLPGDIVFVKKGLKTIIGRGVVQSDYEFLPEREHYKSIRKVRWTDKGEWQVTDNLPLKTLTDITGLTEDIEKYNSLFGEELETPEIEETKYDAYSREQFLGDVFLSSAQFDELVELVKNEKNVILLGAPGVGKTYAAKRLAYAMMREKNTERVMMIQFHQSYSYEDFIMGYRPFENGFRLESGVFYNFCAKARQDEENDYFFIIDEINRGNLSKIFGELFMLIENDKRGKELQLLYKKEQFSVPKNLYIIGLMNTADRSLALVDYALRRRFAFFEMKPGFDSEGFKVYQDKLSSTKFNKLIEIVKELNEEIERDETLGEGFCIGHSYFCNVEGDMDKTLKRIVQFKLIPLLKEYWFDEPDKVKEWSDKLRKAIQ